MKNNKHILIFLSLISVICFALFSCVSADSNSQAESRPEASSTLQKQPLLVLGDYKPEEGQLISYNDALQLYEDEFHASIAASTAQEAFVKPIFSEEILRIRISIPERNIILSEKQGNIEAENAKVFQLYYGFFTSDEGWKDYPAECYDMKTLEPIEDGFSDGWDALCSYHVVKIGPYVLLSFSDYLGGDFSIEDSINSDVLVLSENDFPTNVTPYEIHENISNFRNNELDCHFYEFFSRHFIALKYDEIPKDYTVTITESDDFFTVPFITTYTYDDIMEALNRK